MSNKQHHNKTEEEGAVLIWVFWLLLAISIIVMGAMHLSTLHFGVLSVGTSRTKMRHAAEGGIYNAIYDYLREGAPRRRNEARSYNYKINQYSVKVSIHKETGKISLNQADEALLSAAFAAYGIGETEALKLAAAIADWRDEDTLPRPNGAEANQYLRDGLTPRNAPFETLGELRRVKGVTDRLFICISPVFSVYSTVAQVDLDAAEEKVLHVLEWAKNRRWQGIEWQTEGQGTSVLNPFSSSGGSVLHFEAIVQGSRQEFFSFGAYIRISGNGSHPYDVLAMHEIFKNEESESEDCVTY